MNSITLTVCMLADNVNGVSAAHSAVTFLQGYTNLAASLVSPKLSYCELQYLKHYKAFLRFIRPTYQLDGPRQSADTRQGQQSP